MVERVARVIQTKLYPGEGVGMVHREVARAAIEAMRVPTKAMEMAAMDAATDNSGWDLEVYQARIDAALKD